MSNLLSDFFIQYPSHLCGAVWLRTDDVTGGARRWEIQNGGGGMLGEIRVVDLRGPVCREGDVLTLTDGAIVRVDFAYSSEPFEYRLVLADDGRLYDWLAEEKLKTMVQEER